MSRVEALLSLMESVQYGRSLEELHKNVGGVSDENLDFLYAIRRGHLHEVERLHQAGHGFQAYKQLSVRLAVKYDHPEVLRFLSDSQYLNRDLGTIVSGLARED